MGANTAKHDFPALSMTEKIGMDVFADAMVKLRSDITPEARVQMAKTKKFTLEEHGITVREQPGFRGKPGEMGYFNLEAFNLMDPVRKLFKARALSKQRKKAYGTKSSVYKKKSGEEAPSYTGEVGISRLEITPGQFTREYLFGGKVIGALQRKSVELMEKGSYALADLTAMLDQFPPAGSACSAAVLS